MTTGNSNKIKELGISLADFAAQEIEVINSVFAEFSVGAGTGLHLSLRTRTSFISYEVKRLHGVGPEKVARLLPVLTERITEFRDGLRIPNPAEREYTSVQLIDNPQRIVVATPYPIPLSWQTIDPAQLRPHQMLVGVSYRKGIGQFYEFIDLASPTAAHAITAAISGGGKSTLMKVGVGTLAYATAPADLHIYIIDLKNDDLVDLVGLPHVQMVAGNEEEACDLIHHLDAERIRRRDNRIRTPRILVAMDEVAQLRGYPAEQEMLERLLETGRSLGIHVFAGTQKPTKEKIGDIANSFPLRLAGRVPDAQASYTVTKRKESAAHLLDVPGDFFRVEGSVMRQFKGFWIDAAAGEVEQLVELSRQRWNGSQAQTLHRVGELTSSRSVASATPVGRQASPTPAGLPTSVVTPTQAEAKRPPRPTIPARLVAVFDAYLVIDETGGANMQRGYVSRAIEALYPTDTPRGGRPYNAALEEVKAWLVQYLDERDLEPAMTEQAVVDPKADRRKHMRLLG